MAEKELEKVPIATSSGTEDVEQARPPAYSTVIAKPSSTGRLLRIGAIVLIGGAILILFGAIGAFYYWKVNDKEVYNVHYTMSINGNVQEGLMEIDAGNNLETFKTGSGGEEAIEVHDFQIGITGIRFAGGERCYIKAQAKARLPEVNAMTKESLSFDLEDEIMPAKFDENSLVWVATDQPIKNNNFLSPKILELCGDLQIFWLQPSYPKAGQRRKRGATRKARQTQSNFDMDQFEAAAEERNTRPRANQRAQPRGRPVNATQPPVHDNRPPFNPDNPYHQLEGSEGMSFDPRLDHEGICCIECRRSYTHCERICEPLLGYYPWPYNYQGCRSACRLIMPCSWWVARILGIV
ncbi:leukocyte cell-derived chemotaxin 1 isoform X1 [Anolis carolinensis]|uniref:Leukocyte cell-derived chemotaxin 1 n=1 Tax=Anolis carolinensis TaxID=28377 RepID=G1K8K4_ANOCA|nr:PREDICTED: leukocyte cell-derived chemotaxin 1 isoform X1 [Anolis carolinensis]|eukprot:XP_008105032.1 PREDICTED: leukocyte cell-derived chemotaxin 1 isoform X1 [Anolis carolinensis]